MDDSPKRSRKLNPNQHANLLSKITFFFAYPILRLGLRRDIEEDDIYEIVKSCNAATLGDQIEKEWQREKKKETPNFKKTLLRIFGTEYFILGIIFFLLDTSLMVAKPILLGKVVSYFAPKQTEVTQTHALLYCTGLIGCIFANTFFLNTYFFALEQMGLKLKTAVCSLLYRKSLKLNLNFTSNSAAGQAITLMSKDVAAFDHALFYANQLFVGVFQIGVVAYLMYQQIGVSAIAGTAVLFLFIPIQVLFGKFTSVYKLKTAQKTDQRMQATQEILNTIKIIKMYTWEPFFAKLVQMLRRKEIHNLRILFYLKIMGMSVGSLSAKFALYTCVVTYIHLGYHITAEKAFVVTGCIGSLGAIVSIYIPIGMSMLAELYSCIQRMSNFLQLEETSPNFHNQKIEKRPKISIKNASVKTNTTGYDVLQNISISIEPGLTVLTGFVGAGKSSLLKLILGDIRHNQGSVDVVGNVSYAPQEPWLFPGTIKQNIIFIETFDEARYKSVIKVCALEKDLNNFPHGDKTSVTDKGLNLSRGQKSRISLARAIYKVADIYLLDDCLSAVDIRVSKHIFNECMLRFLKDKIVVLITHQAQYLKQATKVIDLNHGKINFQGSYLDLKKLPEGYSNLIANNVENYEDDYTSDEAFDAGLEEGKESTALLNECIRKNKYGESKEEGAVKKEVFFRYFLSGGGVKMLILVVFAAIMSQMASSWTEYFVSSWVDMEQNLSGFQVNQTTNTTEYTNLQDARNSVITQYSFVIFAAALLTFLRCLIFFRYCCNISTNMHCLLINKIVTAGMSFFDLNLSGNIINRFSRDLQIIDEQLPFVLFEISVALMLLITVFFYVSMVNPLFLIPSGIFAIIIIIARRLYMPTGRSLRRLQGTTRGAVIGHLNSTLEGLTVIRANRAQPILKKEFDQHQDLYNSTSFMCFSTTRGFGFYLDIVAGFFISTIAYSFVLFKTNAAAGKVGLALSQSLGLTFIMEWAVRQWAEFENEMTATERVLEYSKIKSEDKTGSKPNIWPNLGEIVYSNVNLQYSSSSDTILKNISFIIEPNQKIGIVGRTGAGKSSIVSTLLRLYDYKGTITIDGVDTNCIELQFLRSKISVIPQDPVLFSGTVRTNLDPNDEFSDQVIWNALNDVQLKKSVESLSMSVSEDGSNFSIGQRQMFCLARAIIRNNKILVLDEATANVDPETDVLIQRTIRKKFSNCTVITIAHKLDTVMDCDRVLIMDSGMVIEYDSPKVLLTNKDGIFYKLVKEAKLM